MDNCRLILVEGIEALKLKVNDQQIDQLLAFIDLIQKWNKAYNLTAIKDKQDMVSLHLLDSLTVLPYLQGDRIIDIGTGAGLPGIPLAICRPDLNFTLLDSNAKKTRFVQQAVLELKLTNVEIRQSRVEDFHPNIHFDTVITRAFAELARIVELNQHLLAKNGMILAMKGQFSESEIAKIKLPATVIPVRIPGIEAERNLVLINP
jgi:16S rRNA (guanine527-N7)-methyltransferase